jgi:hypothetical protein
LRACRQRPRRCRAAEQRDELAADHSITSSARRSSDVLDKHQRFIEAGRNPTACQTVAVKNEPWVAFGSYNSRKAFREAWNKRPVRPSVITVKFCAALQGRAGQDDEISRDILLSFTPPAKAGELDPEEGLRVVHSIFHFVGCHRTLDGFVPLSKARHNSCPFYTCCNLKLRQNAPQICKRTPWQAVDWTGWEHGTCWYGTGVRVTRPPKT